MKNINNIENNQYIEFLDVSSWKENNHKNQPRTTNNSDIPNYIPQQKLNFFPKPKKNTRLKFNCSKKASVSIPRSMINEN